MSDKTQICAKCSCRGKEEVWVRASVRGCVKVGVSVNVLGGKRRPAWGKWQDLIKVLFAKGQVWRRKRGVVEKQYKMPSYYRLRLTERGEGRLPNCKAYSHWKEPFVVFVKDSRSWHSTFISFWVCYLPLPWSLLSSFSGVFVTVLHVTCHLNLPFCWVLIHVFDHVNILPWKGHKSHWYCRAIWG